MRRWVVFAFVALFSTVVVVELAERDGADPTRCAGLVATGSRCCAEGQKEQGGVCVGRPAHCPAPLTATAVGCVVRAERVAIPGGTLRVGAGDWEAEGRVKPQEVIVAPFFLDSIEITEGAYTECAYAAPYRSDARRCAEPLATQIRNAVEAGRAQGSLTRADAEAYCTFRGGRLPTADEWTWAAAGNAARRYPWGDTGAVCRRATWGLEDGPCGFGHLGPELAGLHPEGATPEGVLDLAGNVSEWVADLTEDGEGLVRGGSFASQLATELRTWRAMTLPVTTRSPAVGARCAYDGEAAAP
jgi:formylglycine-generating enzyme required for sulfatase activity